jgi:hypothetical protein
MAFGRRVEGDEPSAGMDRSGGAEPGGPEEARGTGHDANPAVVALMGVEITNRKK